MAVLVLSLSFIIAAVIAWWYSRDDGEELAHDDDVDVEKELLAQGQNPMFESRTAENENPLYLNAGEEGERPWKKPPKGEPKNDT